MLNMEYKEVEFVLKGRYADRYRWENLTTTWGDGSDSRPTGQDIVDEENLRGKLTDKVFLVTGCSSGAGVATVEALAATGATARARSSAPVECQKPTVPAEKSIS